MLTLNLSNPRKLRKTLYEIICKRKGITWQIYDDEFKDDKNRFSGVPKLMTFMENGKFYHKGAKVFSNRVSDSFFKTLKSKEKSGTKLDYDEKVKLLFKILDMIWKEVYDQQEREDSTKTNKHT